MVDDCRLQDLGFKGSIFTRCNRRRQSAQISERLDRFLNNKAFIKFVGEFQCSPSGLGKV